MLRLSRPASMTRMEHTNEHIFLHAWNVIAQELTTSMRKLRVHFHTFENAWKTITLDALQKIFPTLDIKIQSEIWKRKKDADPENLYKKLEKEVRLVMREDPDYPILLKEIHHPPCGIYVRGKLNLKRYFLSIVGTRKNSLYGEMQTRKLIKKISAYPFITVSGLATGIDTIAHEASLEENLPTIAVLAFGFHHLPHYKFPLMRKILEKDGAMISEYAPDTPGNKFSFPLRNRIIAGLSPVSVIIEAPESSGALITAAFAQEANRDVFAVPGDESRPQSIGCNELIQKQKAIILTTPDDILQAYGLLKTISGKPLQPEILFTLPRDQQEIFDLLSGSTPKSANQLCEETGKDIRHILVALTILEIEKRIRKTPQGYLIY